jgi:hypothetical protein
METKSRILVIPSVIYYHQNPLELALARYVPGLMEVTLEETSVMVTSPRNEIQTWDLGKGRG